MSRGHRAVPIWVVTSILAASGVVTSLTFTLSISLLPTVPDIMDVTANDASWVVTITLLTSSVMTPIMAHMADMYGKRLMLLISLAALLLGSVLVATATAFPAMLAGRALQGFAPSLIPIAISLIRDLLPRERVGVAVALLSGTMGIGTAFGLPLSGFLDAHFGWRSVFWFTAVGGTVLAVCILAFVPESVLRSFGRFDLLGALLFGLTLAALLLVISKAAVWRPDTLALLGLVAGTGAALWIPWQLRARTPMVDIRTAMKRPVLLTNLASLFLTIGTFVNLLITTQQVQAPPESGYGFGLTALEGGLVMLPAGLVIILMAPFTGRMLNRWGGKTVLAAGCAVMLMAYATRVFAMDSIPAIIAQATVVGVGTGLSFAAMPTLIMASVPPSESAAANGINSLVRAVSMSLTSALVALLFATSSLQISGHIFLTREGLQTLFAITAACAGLGAILAAVIPTDTRRS